MIENSFVVLNRKEGAASAIIWRTQGKKEGKNEEVEKKGKKEKGGGRSYEIGDLLKGAKKRL